MTLCWHVRGGGSSPTKIQCCIWYLYINATGTCAQFNFDKSLFRRKWTQMEADILDKDVCMASLVHVCYSFHWRCDFVERLIQQQEEQQQWCSICMVHIGLTLALFAHFIYTINWFWLMCRTFSHTENAIANACCIPI